MSTYGEDYGRRLEELCVKHNELVRAYEAKTVQEHDLAIWWEAYRVLIPIGWHWSQGQMHAAADVALEDYKSKAAELRKT